MRQVTGVPGRYRFCHMGLNNPLPGGDWIYGQGTATERRGLGERLEARAENGPAYADLQTLQAK